MFVMCVSAVLRILILLPTSQLFAFEDTVQFFKRLLNQNMMRGKRQ